MDNLNKALADIQAVCDEWAAVKEEHGESGKWLFSNKLYELSMACEDTDLFNEAAEIVWEDWNESAMEAAGYAPHMWDISQYFEYDNHHGSYFTFRETGEDGGSSLDFWANDVGLEWDSSPNDKWAWTPFEKAIHACYGDTRFSTDRLTPEDYDDEEIEEITDTLTKYVIPAIKKTLEERKAVIAVYNRIKSNRGYYLELTEFWRKEWSVSQSV